MTLTFDRQLLSSPRSSYSTKNYFYIYEYCNYLLPTIPPIPYEAQDAYSKFVLDANDWRSDEIKQEMLEPSLWAYLQYLILRFKKFGEKFRIVGGNPATANDFGFI